MHQGLSRNPVAEERLNPSRIQQKEVRAVEVARKTWPVPLQLGTSGFNESDHLDKEDVRLLVDCSWGFRKF
jgi:hypothetical protein